MSLLADNVRAFDSMEDRNRHKYISAIHGSAQWQLFKNSTQVSNEIIPIHQGECVLKGKKLYISPLLRRCLFFLGLNYCTYRLRISSGCSDLIPTGKNERMKRRVENLKKVSCLYLGPSTGFIVSTLSLSAVEKICTNTLLTYKSTQKHVSARTHTLSVYSLADVSTETLDMCTLTCWLYDVDTGRNICCVRSTHRYAQMRFCSVTSTDERACSVMSAHRYGCSVPSAQIT